MDARARGWRGVAGGLALALLALPVLASCTPWSRGGAGGGRGVSLPAIGVKPDVAGGGRFVDAQGREVLLRGVNVNALVDYWAYGSLPTVFPFTARDAALIASQGWNVVRLAVSWSRIEPAAGRYDERYIDQIAKTVRMLEREGVYTLVDLHQDAWGATLPARPGEACAPGYEPAFGWDGAPGWATLDGGAARCALGGMREVNPAVFASFDAFWRDAPGPGGIGIRTRYAAMLGHLARRFARTSAVVGYDLMNEPNAYAAAQVAALGELATDSLRAIRAAERDAHGFAHLLFVEPSIVWPLPLLAEVPNAEGVVFAPHIYRGGLTSGPIPEEDFAQARAEAANYGSAPVFSGEWGGDPERAKDPADVYFRRHQALQDTYRFSSTLWTWRESCGDPHKAADARDGRVPYVWGEFDVDCATNTVRGPRTALVDQLRRGYVRAAPGRLDETTFDPDAGVLVGRGVANRARVPLEAFVPGRRISVETSGLRTVRVVQVRGGWSVRATAVGGAWSLRAAQR